MANIKKPKLEIIQCCNPFANKSHLQFVQVCDINDKLVAIAQNKNIIINPDQHICDECKQKIYNFRGKFDAGVSDEPGTSASMDTVQHVDLDTLIGPESPAQSDQSSDESDLEEEMFDYEAVKKATNELLIHLELSAIDETKLRGKKYQLKLAQSMTNRLQKCLFPKVNISFTDGEILDQLKKKFKKTKSRSMKMKVLSVLPKQWTIRKIKKEFGQRVSEHI